MTKTLINIVGGFLILIVCLGCLKEIDIRTETEFNSALVIEATITNEFKYQKIKLSRTYRLEEEGPVLESGASVKIIGNGSEYIFQENESGEYLSNVQFAAQSSIDYHLEIVTAGGQHYGSQIMQLTPETPIGDLYVERGLNENNVEGVSIFVDANDVTGATKFYRYEYEETYKVIAPFYSPRELTILNNDFPYPSTFLNQFNTVQDVLDFFFLLDFRPEQEQICYNTVVSNHILVTSTEDLVSDDLTQFRIRFINRNNYIISHRYSILVRQFIQSEAAHIFYKTLNDFSSEGSLFSEIQTGFLEGNVFSTTNQDELVVGYFEVSSVDERRVYFNYDDLFPGDILPPYYITCDDFFSPIFLEEDFAHNVINSDIINALNSGMVFFDDEEYNPNDSPFAAYGITPYILVLGPCGDCTLLGNNVVPDFWEE